MRGGVLIVVVFSEACQLLVASMENVDTNGLDQLTLGTIGVD